MLAQNRSSYRALLGRWETASQQEPSVPALSAVAVASERSVDLIEAHTNLVKIFAQCGRGM